MITHLLIIVLAWVLFVVVPTIPAIRRLLARPLVVCDRDARGDAGYILAGGNAFRERLGAAAELFNLGRISRIIFMCDDAPSAYNFTAKANWTKTQWALDFLVHRGVPRDGIQVTERPGGMFGTLQEARNFRKSLPADVQRLILVSSAPHMRRCVLAFRRVLPP